MAQVNGLMDKSKELQKEILMEKLRSKTSQLKNLTETSKAVRMALLVSKIVYLFFLYSSYRSLFFTSQTKVLIILPSNILLILQPSWSQWV